MFHKRRTSHQSNQSHMYLEESRKSNKENYINNEIKIIKKKAKAPGVNQRNASQYEQLMKEESIDPVALIHDMRYGIIPEKSQNGSKRQASTGKPTSR